MKAIKIIAGILILGIMLLAYIANHQYNRAEWWKTKPMRDARHKKRPGDLSEEEEEEEKEPAPLIVEEKEKTVEPVTEPVQ